MTPNWLLNVLLVIFSVCCAIVLYLFQQKHFHQALWAGFFSVTFLLLICTLYIRNHLKINELENSLKPNFKVSIQPDSFPGTNPFRYPLQEYHLFIANENDNSAEVHDFSLKLFFPNIVSQANGYPDIYSGEQVRVTGLYINERNANGISTTRDAPADPRLANLMSLSIQQWQKNGNLENSNVVSFYCERWPQNAVFEGSIVIDLSKKPSLVKTPDAIGSYAGSYHYTIAGKNRPPIKLEGEIAEPNMEEKMAEHHFDIGLDLIKQNNIPEAISELSKTLELDPQHSGALFNRAYCHFILGKFPEALSYFDDLINKYPRYKKAFFLRALTKKRMNYSEDEIRKDFKTSCDLGFEEGCREYWKSILAELNPSNGYFVYTIGNEGLLLPDGKKTDLIPHISKEDFSLHFYKDTDNSFKVNMSNAVNKNINLIFNDLNWLKNKRTSSKHQVKVEWYNNEYILSFDDVIVDVYPKKINLSEKDRSDVKPSAANIFRQLYDMGPNIEQGTIVFSVSKQDWLEKNGQLIILFPHIYISKFDFEVHGYRDKDNIFNFLLNTPNSKETILKYSDLDKLKNEPQHPKHTIMIRWEKERKELLIDGAGPVDHYPKTP